MSSKNGEGYGNKLANNLLVVIIGLVASFLGIFAYVTNVQIIQELVDSWVNPGLIKNPLAEADGIVWEAFFYNNKELKDPIIFDGKIRGARNGLRVNWDIGSPNRKVNNDFFSGVFTTSVNFNADNYCFLIEVDDGARIFIDGKEIRNVWWGHTPRAVYKTPYQLSEGPHVIQFYYYDEYEKSSFHLWWYENPGPECVTVGHPGVP